VLVIITYKSEFLVLHRESKHGGRPSTTSDGLKLVVSGVLAMHVCPVSLIKHKFFG